MLKLRKKSATGFQNKAKYSLPEGKGKKKRQLIKIYRKYKIFILFTLPILFILFLISIELVFKPFSITNINSKNFTMTNADKTIVTGKKLYLINEQKINSALLPNHIEIQKFSITKNYPSTINIVGKKREGVFKIKKGDTYYIVDDFGVIFSTDKTSKLPDLPVKISTINIGTKIDKQDLNLYTNIVKNLLDLKLTVKSVYLEGTYVYVVLKDNYTIRFDTNNYLNEITMFKKAVTHINSSDKIEDIRFVDNKVLIQYAR